MKLWRRLRLALRTASRIVSTAALRTASIAASRTVSRTVSRSSSRSSRRWVGLSRVSRVESSRVELSREARPVKGPGLGQVWAWAWRVCYGDWLRNAGSDVAIGCIIMEGCYD